jgi:hypothetical protein
MSCERFAYHDALIILLKTREKVSKKEECGFENWLQEEKRNLLRENYNYN